MPSLFKTFLSALAVAGSIPLLSASPVELSERAGSVSCVPYTPIGWKSRNGKLYFYDNNPTDQPASGPGFHAPTLPANATIVYYKQESHLYLAKAAGLAFTFAACNVSSSDVSLTTNTTQSSCTHGSCYHTYTNYVQIHSPATGHCLANKGEYIAPSYLIFEECDDNPTSTAQYFQVSQQVTYAPNYASIYSYGTVDVLPVSNTDNEGDFIDWILSRADNRTVQTTVDTYSQVGLSASLLQAQVEM